ncbi:uncharacterized protein GGS22DRAFT_17762 [Annulohypoxylon maeteangense]|uniref:uncharacterized protein n=1 Tax=Annulohypoxylon maeteangense TaxID=1927788 RepID=UPI002007C1B0|nr:uncharacterized protein GGS22DRAFT_17762 [Annulohypoxylon maeteangense]KAI0890733.1 hypothetical protein GGS22DRAFT_17762 [Annulohypoxylon maeteangense]
MASANYNSHPLPAPPQQGQNYNESYQQPVPPQQNYLQQQRQQRQRQAPPPQAPEPQRPERVRPKSRAFSFRSDKSQKSANNPHHKVDLTETHVEKEARRLHGKTDPTFALTESEPAMDAQSKGGFGQAPLRSFQHKDVYGNPITDPDRSNPTRSRLERPLDTIRGFEAAIDGGYNRNSILRSDSESVANWSRRGSYYGNNQPRFPQESYYGGRSNPALRPESVMMDPRQSAMNGPRESYYEGPDGGQYGRNNAAPRIRYSRMQSDPYANGNGRGVPDRNVYPMPNNHRSYETVASGSGSGSLGEPNGYQTDPTSSDNSSIDRRSPPKRQEPVNDYGISFGQAPQTPSLGLGASGGPQAVPRKENGTLLRKPSKAAVSKEQAEPRPGIEKRKSWFKRFSKS